MKVFVVFVLLGLASSGDAQTVCRTPNNEEGRCIPFNQCSVLKQALQAANSRPSQELIRFLRESQCAHNNGPWVCCGSVANFQSFEPINTPPASSSYREPPQSHFNPRNHKNYNLLPSGRQCGVQGSDNKILGGEEADLDEFPWMTLLEYRKNGYSSGHACGGMLISDRYVLTAAHCVTGAIVSAVGNLFQVRLGEHDTNTDKDCKVIKEGYDEYTECSEPFQDIAVEDIIPHPNYNFDRQETNDIALVRLARPATLNYFVQPICLPLNGEQSSPGMNMSIAGWGKTEKNQPTSNVKLKAQVPIVSPQQCSNKYAKAGRQVSNKQFCAGGLLNIDTCRGDSGGPIMTTFPGVTPPSWYVEGVVSYGPDPCGMLGWPGVYTKVSSYVNWILDNIKP